MRYRVFALAALALAACDQKPEEPASKPQSDASAPQQDSSSAADASSPVDAAAPAEAGPCGITLVGPKWGPQCQAWLDQNCCPGEKSCANIDQCKGWVSCMDSCAPGSQSVCLKKCGQVSLFFADTYNCINDPPPDGSPPMPSGCAWPTP